MGKRAARKKAVKMASVKQTQKKVVKRTGWLLFIILVLVATNGLTFVALFAKARAAIDGQDMINKADDYPLLAKRIFVEDPNDALINFESLRASIRQKFKAPAPLHSLYFEYLPTGTTIKRDSETQMIAASLVKLPLIMNLYHAAELGRVNLDDEVVLTPNDLDPTFGDLYKQGAGTTKTLQELAELGLKESDNTATLAINRTIQGKLTGAEESMPWLDIDYTMVKGEAVVSAREYSSILKCLYFSCYLSAESSQHILDHMSESIFTDRLTKYIPSEVKVAHKIGVFNPQDVHSDCGIFYVPKRPYVLCLMLKGNEITASQKMADISKEVYDWVSLQDLP
jgi:beta-lactamase class A